MTVTRTVVNRNDAVAEDQDFVREMTTCAERFATVRGAPQSALGRLVRTLSGTSTPRLDYSLASLGEVDRVLEAMPEGAWAHLALAPILTGGLERPDLAATAYFGEVIRRHSRRGWRWAGLGVWDDDYALERWGEGMLPPAANLISADRGFVLALLDAVVAHLDDGWSSVVAAIGRHADFDDFVVDWAGPHLVATGA